METELLKSENVYLDHCAVEGIGTINRKYGSQWCHIENGERTDRWEKYRGESLHITEKPTHYPCILAWHHFGEDDDISGIFIYPEDFNDEQDRQED